MLSAGTKIDRFELVCPVRSDASRGVAEVWVAKQSGKHGFAKLVALTAIAPRWAADPAFRAALLEDARAASAIEHPNVAQVLDLGEAGGVLYLVGEHVDGDALAARTTTPEPAVALRIVADACAGLDAAHRRGVVHGALSPEAILVAASGAVKVAGFGMARARDRAGAADEGERAYRAPEQARGAASPVSDVFAAGALLHALLAGRARADAWESLPEGVPRDVAAIVDRAMEPDPARRWATAIDMKAAIEEAIANLGRAPDVAAWASESLSEAARERRAIVAQVRDGPRAGDIPEPPDLDLGARRPAALAPTVLAPDVHAPTMPMPDPAEAQAALAPTVLDEPTRLPARRDAGPRERRHVAPARDFAPATVAQPEPAAPPRGPIARSIADEPRPSKRRGFPKLLIAIVLMLVAAGAFVLALPAIVKSRIVATAKGAGVDLTIDRVSVGLSGVALHDVAARIPSVPGVDVTIGEVYADGWSARAVRLSGVDAKIEGRAAEVGEALVRFYATHRQRFAGTPSEPRHLAILGGRFTWTNPLGEDTRVQAGDVGAEIDSASYDDIHARLGRFDVKTPKTTFGPWSISLDTGATSSRVRLSFDPPVPDGPSALYVWGSATPAQLTLRVPRAPIARLGLRADDLHLPADAATELEVDLDASTTATGRIEGKVKAQLYGARLKGMKAPVDVKVDGAFAGAPGKPLDLDRTTVSVGPFVANVAGTITPTELGFRADTTWRTQPIPCERLVRAEVKSWGTFAATLQEIVQRTGAVKVTGSAYAAGTFSWDSRAPEDAALTFTTRESCGLSIFGL